MSLTLNCCVLWLRRVDRIADCGRRGKNLATSRLARLALCLAAGAWFAASLAQAAPPAEQDWPQWRGPLGTGAAPTANPPLEWSDSKNIKWKVAIPGEGTATPIVWKDQIFIQTAIPVDKKEPAPAADADAATDGAPAGETTPAAEPGAPATQSPDNTDRPQRERGRRGGRGGPGGPPGGRGGRGGRNGRAPGSGGEYQFAVRAVDRKNGRTLWQQVARQEVPHEGHHADNSYASHSPVTDGTCLCAYFGSHGLYCYDLDGKLKWEKDLGKQETRNGFGEGSSPALFAGTVVVNWDHEGDDFIVAFDKETGRELWRKPREEHTTWATPLIVEHAGRAQVVTAATDKIRSYDLASGELLWECAGLTTNAIPSPVAANDMVYVTSGFKGNALLAIRLGRTGDLTGTDAIVWSHNKNTPYVPSPLLSGDRLYFYASNNAILSCFDVQTGKALFGPQRLEGLRNVYASPVAGGGRVYLVGRDGAALVIKDADSLEVLATNQLDDSFSASPALVGPELILRGRAHLYCISAE
jgi:outer membrane protein assembly factor BamB